MSRRSVPRIDPTDLRDHADEPRIARVWERIEQDLNGLEVGPARAPRYAVLAIAAAFGAFGVGVLVGRVSGKAPSTVTIASAAIDKVAVDVLAAGSLGRTFPLPGGGEIALEPGTTVEVERAGSDAVTLRLVQGEAAVDTTKVAHGPGLTIVVGEAKLNTQAGSALRVSRNPDDLDITVIDGSVNVTAPDGPRKLVGGQHAEAVPTHQVLSAAEPNDSPRPHAAKVRRGPSRRHLAEPSVAVAASTDWLERYDDSDWGAALELLKQKAGGIDGAVDTAGSAKELMAIGDLTRKAGDAAASTKAFKRVVDEFPGDQSAAAASYYVAKSYAAAGQEAEARKYFERNLELAPESSLAPGVRCDLIQLERNNGEAVRKAKDYTAKYPNGRCKDVERLLQQGGDVPEPPKGDAKAAP